MTNEAAETLALEISQAMARLIGSACCVEDSPVASQLAISKVVHWELFIDAVVMEYGGGNVFDAVALASKAALSCTKLPMLDIVEGEVPGTYDVELASDISKLPAQYAPKVSFLHLTYIPYIHIYIYDLNVLCSFVFGVWIRMKMMKNLV